MARVDFYHLTRDPAPTVVARLAERVCVGDGRLMICASDGAARAAIDTALWATNPNGFLGHAPAETDMAQCADEPIVIAPQPQLPATNGATTIAIADGVWDDVALGFDRALFLFDGSSIDDARAVWRALAAVAAVERHYWAQDAQGRWREGP